MTGSRSETGVGRGRVGAALLLTACAGSGCGFGEDPAPVPSEWTVEALGTIPWEVEGAGAVERVALGPDARIYLVREGEERVHVHEPGGAPAASIVSGEEDGFRSVADVGFTGDSLYVLDSDRSRVEVFSPAGEPRGAWTWRPRTFTAGSGGVTVFVPGSPRTFVLRGDGTALVRPNTAAAGARAPESPGLVRWARRVPLLHLDRRAVVRDTVVWEELRGSVLFLPDGGGDTLRVPVPFEDGPLFELMPDGSGVVVVDRRVPSDTAADYTVRLVEPGRDTVWIRSLPYTPRDLDAASVRRVLGASLAPGPGGEPPDSGLVAEVESALRAIDALPSVWPPVTRVAGGQDGRVWIGREEAGDSTVWQVLDPRGRLAGWVDLPRGWEVLAARGDLVVARDPDGPDGARLVVHRVTR